MSKTKESKSLTVKEDGEWGLSKQAKCKAYIHLKQELRHVNLTLQRPRAHGVLVRLAALLGLGEELDEVVDAQDGDGRLRGELQAFGLHHGGLVHARLLVVSGLAVQQVQTDPDANHTAPPTGQILHGVSSLVGFRKTQNHSPLEILAFGINLSLIVEGPQLSHQIRRILRRVDGQRLGDDEQRACKLGDGQLLSGALSKHHNAEPAHSPIGRVDTVGRIATRRFPYHAGGVILQVD